VPELISGTYVSVMVVLLIELMILSASTI